jgi:magnesium-transporting ATPase (P-type)
MSSSEWELLVIAEDIEPGDSILVEEEDGSSADMVFIKVRPRGVVELLDIDGSSRLYSASSLEELKGYSCIVGKSDAGLSAKSILDKR